MGYRAEPSTQHLQSLVVANLCLNRVEEARSIAADAVEANPNSIGARLQAYGIAMLDHDEDVAAAHVEWSRGQPGEHLMWGLQAAIMGLQGRMRESTAMFERALEVPANQGRAFALSDIAGVLYVAGYRERALEALRPALREDVPLRSKLGAAGLLALLGENEEAEELAAQVGDQYPSDDVMHEAVLPAIRALIAINRSDPDTALDLLQDAGEFERAEPVVNYARGLAYSRTGSVDEALAEFQKVLDSPGTAFLTTANAIVSALASFENARVFIQAGRVVEARQAYEKIFADWSSADAELPRLIELREEYANLS